MLMEKLRTGLEGIDSDHEQIFFLIDRLLTSTVKEERYEILTYLLFYTTEHALREEQLMMQYDYPHLTHHKMLHAELREVLASSFQALLKIDAEVELLKKIKTAIEKHILIHDLALIKFLRKIKAKD